MESSVSVITSLVTDLTVNSVQVPIMGNASVVSQDIYNLRKIISRRILKIILP